MTTRKARANEEADPCGMTTKKAKSKKLKIKEIRVEGVMR
jgi:hypothetical protein